MINTLLIDALLLSKYKMKIFYNLFLTKNYNEFLKCMESYYGIDYLYPNKIRFINYDELLLYIGDTIFKKNNVKLNNIFIERRNPKILLLNSELHDSGGHTELALRFVEAFNKDYNISTMVTGLSESSRNTAPIKSKIIKQYSNDYVELPVEMTYEDKVIYIYNYIINNSYTTIFINIHMYDAAATAAIGLIKKYSNINIIFWNHADHRFSLSTTFADTILTRTENGKPLLKYLRKYNNIMDIVFLEKTNNPGPFSDNDIFMERQRLGIKEDAKITLTGAPDYKIFSDRTQEYIKLIRRLLDANKNMVHIIIGASYNRNIKIIEKIIGEELIRERRLIFQNATPIFELYIQMSHLYIDSFPQGSALTLIDCIRNMKPVVIKVNKIDPLRSFQMYLSDQYKYSCNTVDEMYRKINILMKDKDEYENTAREVRQYYVERYAIVNSKKKYAELIK